MMVMVIGQWSQGPRAPALSYVYACKAASNAKHKRQSLEGVAEQRNQNKGEKGQKGQEELLRFGCRQVTVQSAQARVGTKVVGKVIKRDMSKDGECSLSSRGKVSARQSIRAQEER